MSVLPREILAIIDSGEGGWSDHAADERVRLGLEWEDVLEVARTSVSRKRTRDPRTRGVRIEALVGRDRGGRLLYMAGKVIAYESTTQWYFITIHEAD